MIAAIMGLFSLYSTPLKWDRGGFFMAMVFWLPLVLTSAVCLVLGAVFFFISQNQAMDFASISYVDSHFYTVRTFYGLVVPMVGVSFIGLMISIVWGHHRNLRAQPTIKTE